MSNEHIDTRTSGPEPAAGTTDETAREVDARVYRVLGEQLLVRPDPERVDAVGIWASEWRCNAETLPPEFDAALERIEAGATADEEALRTAYTHLFRGIAESAIDPPYESMYVDGSFYSGTTTEIRKGYRWAGFDVDDTFGNEPPDHLGLELQFLGELVAMDAFDTDAGESDDTADADGDDPEDVDAGESDDTADADGDEPDVEDAIWWLLDDHLTEWLPSYHARVQRDDPHEYYAGLLDLALAVVTSHHKRLAKNR